MRCKDLTPKKHHFNGKPGVKHSKNDEIPSQTTRVSEQTKLKPLRLSEGHQQRATRFQSITPRGFHTMIEKILRSVLVGRPLHVNLFVADYLDAELARRTFNEIVYGCQLKKSVRDSLYPTESCIALGVVPAKEAADSNIRDGMNTFTSGPIPDYEVRAPALDRYRQLVGIGSFFDLQTGYGDDDIEYAGYKYPEQAVAGYTDDMVFDVEPQDLQDSAGTTLPNCGCAFCALQAAIAAGTVDLSAIQRGQGGARHRKCVNYTPLPQYGYSSFPVPLCDATADGPVDYTPYPQYGYNSMPVPQFPEHGEEADAEADGEHHHHHHEKTCVDYTTVPLYSYSSVPVPYCSSESGSGSESDDGCGDPGVDYTPYPQYGYSSMPVPHVPCEPTHHKDAKHHHGKKPKTCVDYTAAPLYSYSSVPVPFCSSESDVGSSESETGHHKKSGDKHGAHHQGGARHHGGGASVLYDAFDGDSYVPQPAELSGEHLTVYADHEDMHEEPTYKAERLFVEPDASPPDEAFGETIGKDEQFDEKLQPQYFADEHKFMEECVVADVMLGTYVAEALQKGDPAEQDTHVEFGMLTPPLAGSTTDSQMTVGSGGGSVDSSMRIGNAGDYGELHPQPSGLKGEALTVSGDGPAYPSPEAMLFFGDPDFQVDEPFGETFQQDKAFDDQNRPEYVFGEQTFMDAVGSDDEKFIEEMIPKDPA